MPITSVPLTAKTPMSAPPTKAVSETVWESRRILLNGQASEKEWECYSEDKKKELAQKRREVNKVKKRKLKLQKPWGAFLTEGAPRLSFFIGIFLLISHIPIKHPSAVALSGSYPFPADENTGKRGPHTRAFSPKYTSYQTRKLYTVQILRLLSFFPA